MDKKLYQIIAFMLDNMYITPKDIEKKEKYYDYLVQKIAELEEKRDFSDEH